MKTLTTLTAVAIALAACSPVATEITPCSERDFIRDCGDSAAPMTSPRPPERPWEPESPPEKPEPGKPDAKPEKGKPKEKPEGWKK